MTEDLPQPGGWRDAATICLRPHHLRRTLLVALVVGTVLFVINQLDVVIGGRAGSGTWLKVGLTYLVPFMVSNYGILLAHRGGSGARAGRRRPGRPASGH